MSAELGDDLRRTLEFLDSFGFEGVPKRSDVASAASADLQRCTNGTGNADERKVHLEGLREEIGDCVRCKLSRGRKNIVFGEGNPTARLMFVGEGPGREEDIQARPFVGDAGQLLTRLIEKMGLQRSEVYIANVVKCRPPMNRDPHEDEIATCIHFLRRQIEIIQPEVLVALGRISGHSLLGIEGPVSKFSITRSRGVFYDLKMPDRTIPVMLTFHPAYLLRNSKDKWLTWEDAQAVLKRLGLEEHSR